MGPGCHWGSALARPGGVKLDFAATLAVCELLKTVKYGSSTKILLNTYRCPCTNSNDGLATPPFTCLIVRVHGGVCGCVFECVVRSRVLVMCVGCVCCVLVVCCVCG